MRLHSLLIAAVVAFISASAEGYDLVGAESCKGCHVDAYQSWKESKHARAKESLSPQQQKDARCLSCHSPSESEQQSNVTCETCHGGGQYYTPAYVMKDSELARLVGLIDPSEKACRTCHDASSPSLRPFEFLEKLKLIDHWTIERQKRAAAAEQKPVDVKPEPKKKAP